MRFRIADGVEEHRSRYSWPFRTDDGRQLVGYAGELRLVRNRPLGRSSTLRTPVAVLTINGITDVTSLACLDVADPSPYSVGMGRGTTAVASLDVHFVARLWDLAVPEHTRCQVHLEGLFHVLPHWPLPR